LVPRMMGKENMRDLLTVHMVNMHYHSASFVLPKRAIMMVLGMVRNTDTEFNDRIFPAELAGWRPSF